MTDRDDDIDVIRRSLGRARWSAFMEDNMDEYRASTAALDRLAALLAKMDAENERLRRYARHAPECEAAREAAVRNDVLFHWRCVCGLDAALAATQEPPALDIGIASGQFPGPGLVGVEQSLRQAAEPLNPEHYDRPIGAQEPPAEGDRT